MRAVGRVPVGIGQENRHGEFAWQKGVRPQSCFQVEGPIAPASSRQASGRRLCSPPRRRFPTADALGCVVLHRRSLYHVRPSTHRVPYGPSLSVIARQRRRVVGALRVTTSLGAESALQDAASMTGRAASVAKPRPQSRRAML
jgi:hypothetical protein